MKLIIVAFVAVLGLAAAAPQNKEYKEPIKILRSEFDQQPDGAYLFNFESEDGSKRQEQGELKQVVDEDNKPQTVVIVRGSYTYIDSEGKEQTVNYFADEGGYHAEGDIIPKPARR